MLIVAVSKDNYLSTHAELGNNSSLCNRHEVVPKAIKEYFKKRMKKF